MEDGGRSAHARAAAAAAKKKKEKNDANTSREQQPRHLVPFGQIPGITDALRERLEALGATEPPPSFMIGKSLLMSDVNRDQARLLFSCKRGSLPEFTDVFTETEMQLVEDKIGLLVTAFDRDGRSYSLTCKYLESNRGYRFITGWRAYVEDNGLGVAMRVELWWFRSRKLHNRYELRERQGRNEKVPVMVDSGHPDGSLGLVLLHYGNELLEPEQAAAEEPDEAPPVQETENDDLEPEQAAAADEPDEAPPVQETETETETGHMESKKMTTTAEDKLADDGGTCAELIKSKTTIAEDKLADGGGECAEPRIRERNTVISDEDVLKAAKRLIQLRHYGGGGGGGGGGRRGGQGT